MSTKYALIVFSRQMLTNDKTDVLTPDGTQYWVINDEKGIVTSARVIHGSANIPKNVKFFDSEEEAFEFAMAWDGHPWWCSPDKKNYRCVTIEPVYETVQAGWKATPEEGE